MNSTKNNTYRIINYTLLGFDLFIVTYPFWAMLLNKISPILTSCAYNKMTGKLCPFCGGTRMIKSIWHGSFDFEILSIPTLVILFYMITNIIFRLIYLLDAKAKDNSRREKIYKIIDLITGCALAIYLAIVIILFTIDNVI